MGKLFQLMMFTLVENVLNRFLLMPPVPHSNLQAGFLKICFPQDERGGKNNDLLYQNSIRKYEDDLEYRVIYILYDL